MSLIVIPNIFTVGAVIVASQHNINFSTIYSDYNGNITDVNISASASISDTKLGQITTAGKVSGAAITSLTSIPSGAGVIPVANLGTGTANSSTILLGSGSFGSLPYIKFTNTQSQNVGGGSTTSGSWQIAVLNTKDNDTANIATLTSNKITLPSGTYQVKSLMPIYYGAGSTYGQIRLFNNTDSSVIMYGCPIIAASGLPAFTFLNGLFTISSSKDLYLQYQVSQSQATFGQGNPANFGSEIYAVLEFNKVG